MFLFSNSKVESVGADKLAASEGASLDAGNLDVVGVLGPERVSLGAGVEGREGVPDGAPMSWTLRSAAKISSSVKRPKGHPEFSPSTSCPSSVLLLRYVFLSRLTRTTAVPISALRMLIMAVAWRGWLLRFGPSVLIANLSSYVLAVNIAEYRLYSGRMPHLLNHQQADIRAFLR